MKRSLPPILALLGLLLCAGPASAILQGGYDEATRELEEGFKIVATERIASDNECYPSPGDVAAALRREIGIEVVVAPSLGSVEGFDLVNVIRRGTECNRLVLAIRTGAKGRVFVLDSDYGPVYVQGGRGLGQESLAQGMGPLRDLMAATSDFRMHKADANARFAVLCPAGTSPLGGGMFNATPLAADGEGIYPHSYERLGVQGGFHVTSTMVDPSPAHTAARRGVLQVICGRGLVPTSSPHETVFVKRHGTGTVTARCPGGTRLFSGGFQRTNFTTPGVSHGGIFYGGDYITESRAVGATAWRVSAGAADSGGGELTAIAYCANDPSLPLTEVSASVPVGQHESATATTPRCPPGRALIAGGFSFGGSHDALFAEGYFTRAGSWSASGYGWFGSAELTAYGYCLNARDTVNRAVFPRQMAEPSEEAGKGSSRIDLGILIYVGLALAGLALAGWVFHRRRQSRGAGPR